MTDLRNFTIINMIKSWNDNQEIIKDYIQNRERFIENNDTNKGAAIFGLSVGVFLIIFLLSIVLFFYSIYLLIVNWNILPDWAKIVGLISLFFFPLFTIIVVLIAKQQNMGMRDMGMRDMGMRDTGMRDMGMRDMKKYNSPSYKLRFD